MCLVPALIVWVTPGLSESLKMEDEGGGYRWETGYEKTWEAITEDGDGLLEVSVRMSSTGRGEKDWRRDRAGISWG